MPFRLTQTGPRHSLQLHQSRTRRCNCASAKPIRGSEEISSDGVEKIAGAEFNQKVRGTAITYEDLALRFIYWPNAKVVGEDYIHTRRVWKLELQPPGRQSQYSRVILWCEQQSGALMRMEGYDWNGKLTKRFGVVSVQKIEGKHRFSSRCGSRNSAPETGKVRTRTYLEIKK